MIKIFFSFILIILGLKLHAQEYKYVLDLKNVVNDKVKVTLHCPPIKEKQAEFIMPRAIPGSYSWKEYGRFLSEVKAFDENGRSISISNKKNIFYIKKKANKVARLEYWIDDTWDDTDLGQFIFQPGGSNIESGKNFVINNHAFMGYFEGYKNLPFQIEILKPQDMYGSTWLKKEIKDPEKDVLRANGYFELADNPIMYCKADTNSFVIDNTRIHISSYSNNKIVKADSLREWIKPLAYSLKNFMGELPVSDYHFIFYFASSDQLVKVPPGKGLSGYGALEHHHSSFYYLPEMDDSDAVKDMVQDVGAHEFLHILTPLNLHSTEVADFNFKNPEMSQHLWLYEGVTEYFSWLVRIQNNMVSEEDFFKEMNQKLNRSAQYGSFSFTEMSKNVLKPEFQEKYSDVYLKGAVLAMMLDQLLIKKSEGKYGLKHLMKDLIKKYGSARPFDDDQLFGDIVALTYPELDDFFNNYVKGQDRLPLDAYMNWFGYQYEAESKVPVYYIASLSVKLNDKGQIEVNDLSSSNIGLKKGDVITEVDGITVGFRSFQDVWNRYFQFNTSPDAFTLKIIRNGKEIENAGKPVAGFASKKHHFEKLNSEAGDHHYLREVWLKGNYIE